MPLLPSELIKKKRDGYALSPEEVTYFIDSYLDGTVADYQMSAFLMSVFFKGMNDDETWALTQAMLHSGVIVDFSAHPHFKTTRRVDKHSTGGVGDKTSLIIGPIVACAGIQVPMISGRGLGHTGGTLDKLESIPGFDVFLSIDEFKKQVSEFGLCFIGQTKEIVPADKRMYALRDVTGTVECIPLICASIMSKKLAEGIDGLVLDIKCGKGAFMKTPKTAEALARALIKVGKKGKKKVVALITDMSQPLGNAVGNSLEVEECIDVLENKGPKDLRELSLQLSAYMILLGGKASKISKAYKMAEQILESGKALEVFKKTVHIQKGQLQALPKAKSRLEVLSKKSGYVKELHAEKIGIASLKLGAGRAKTDDKIDPSAGLIIHKKIGDKVKKGEKLVTIFHNGLRNEKESIRLIEDAYFISLQKVKQPRLILKIVK